MPTAPSDRPAATMPFNTAQLASNPKRRIGLHSIWICDIYGCKEGEIDRDQQHISNTISHPETSRQSRSDEVTCRRFWTCASVFAA